MKAEEGNKLIAEFIGLKVEYKTYPNPQLDRWEVDKGTHWSHMEYHTSWDWLMPVCKKGHSIWVGNYKEDERCAELFEDIWSGLWHFNIEECHESVVEFIKWYNLNNQP